MSEDYKNGLISYTSRDYESLKSEFFNLVNSLTELWKPEADSDPGVILGKYLASVADTLGVNLDWLANEIYAPSVSQRKNAEKIFGLIGYELGFYTAARTEITFTNTSETTYSIDFGFNGSNFSTLNAYTDISGQSRVITYNVLPNTNKYGSTETRSRRQMLTENLDVFVDTDKVTLGPGDSVVRVGIEGELRQYSVSVSKIKESNYIVTLPSQHIDTTAVWVKARQTSSTGEFISTQWVQCASPSEFITPEPRFAVTYDNYSNAQVQISNYLNQLENYDDNWITIFWVDCSGVIGCVGENVLSTFLTAKSGQTVTENSGDLTISNLANTVELPNTYTITGRSPETAKEAYKNSRKYINTWDSLITLPDFNRFLIREPGVDTGIVIDCQKALEINLSIYNDENLTDSEKSKMYITNYDFPAGEPIFDWKTVLNLGFDPSDPQKFVFATNFKRYTAMCFCIANNFQASRFGQGQVSTAQIENSTKFNRYKPPVQFIDAVNRDFRPLQAMSVDLQFGYARIFNFYCVGTIYPHKPVDKSNAENIIAKVKEALTLYFHPTNRNFGVKPTLIEIVDIIRNADSRIDYFDAGSAKTSGIVWDKCDIQYFNPISFARFVDPGDTSQNIRIAPDYIVKN